MKGKIKFVVAGLLPIILLLLVLVSFVKFGPLGVLESEFPPVEQIFIQRTIFEPNIIVLEIINDGPEPVTIAQVTVNEVFWKFSMKPTQTLSPLEKGYITLIYPWVEGNPYEISLIASDGVTFEGSVDVATQTPKFNFFFLKTFVLLGIYVGVIPILLGLLWFPFLRKLRGKWYSFLLSLTVGFLILLGFDALSESFELLSSLPESYNGIGILVIGFLLAILILSAVTYKTEHHKVKRGVQYQSLVWGYLIALGIGLHNLGEGLAIGSAYAIGEIALGATLVIGFMVHNLTEGIAIVSPLTKTFSNTRKVLPHLIMMGLLAGAPTILGTIIGGFSYSAAFAVFFLAIGAGAIFDVTFDIMNHMARGNWISLFTITNVIGFLAGLLIIYATGFLVLG